MRKKDPSFVVSQTNALLEIIKACEQSKRDVEDVDILNLLLRSLNFFVGGLASVDIASIRLPLIVLAQGDYINHPQKLFTWKLAKKQKTDVIVIDFSSAMVRPILEEMGASIGRNMIGFLDSFPMTLEVAAQLNLFEYNVDDVVENQAKYAISLQAKKARQYIAHAIEALEQATRFCKPIV